MDQHIRNVVMECTRASDEERKAFPVVVGELIAAGVERYHADLVKHEKTYYLPTGESIVTEALHHDEAPADAFRADRVEAAVRASQRQEIGYREFCRRVLEAGCAGYWVSIKGKRAVYYGRTGETHVELFPSTT